MSLNKPNKAQLRLLEKLSFPDEEWARDIIWLKRMDAVSNPEMQAKASRLYIATITKHRLFTTPKKRFKLISEQDNVWDSQRQLKDED